MAKKKAKKNVKKSVKKNAPKKAKNKLKKPAQKAEIKAKVYKSALTKSDLKTLRNILIEKRDDLSGVVMQKKHSELPENEIGDEVDRATSSVEKEMLFELTNTEKMILDTIEAAIRKMDHSDFGLCESCGKPVSLKRLKAMPWVRYCIDCQKTF